MSDLAARYSSRKLLAAFLLVVLASWLLVRDYIDQDMWWNVVQLSLGGYFAVNLGQKAVEQVASAVQAYLARPKTGLTNGDPK